MDDKSGESMEPMGEVSATHSISIFLSLFCLLLFIFMFSASVHSGE